jgi:hypothetical protein
LKEIREMRSEIKAVAAQVTLSLWRAVLCQGEHVFCVLRCCNSPLPQFSVVFKGEHENLKFRCQLRAIGDKIFKR